MHNEEIILKTNGGNKMKIIKLYKDFTESHHGNKYPEKIDPKKAFGLFPRCMTTMKMCEERGIEYLPMDELEDLAKKYEVHLKWQYFSDQPYFKVEARVV